MKSNAPSLMAPTAMAMSPCPVIRISGTVLPHRRIVVDERELGLLAAAAVPTLVAAAAFQLLPG
jgi:hypothetical protein